MTKVRSYDLPLERLLETTCSECPDSDFPSAENYYTRYCNIVGQLEREVYPHVNEGLAALSKESGLYTDHGPSHFDEVVKYAGLLLDLKNNRSDIIDVFDDVLNHKWVLKPYEIYALLLSIRLHDVGNIYGRENHENAIKKVIHEFKIVHLSTDKIETAIIAAIAGAHGGKTRTGDKDTIGNLMANDNSHGHICDFDNRKIAAFTRFADEICENRSRVSSSEAMDIPDHNLVYHKYANGIVGNYIKDKTLYFDIQFHIGNLTRLYKIYKDEELIEVNLPEVALGRLRKTELERRYCNRFIPEQAQLKEISISVVILNDTLDEESYSHEQIDRTTFTLKEEGYPAENQVQFDEKTTLFMSYERFCKTNSEEVK